MLNKNVCIERILNRKGDRNDDNEDVAKKRIFTYEKETLPIVNEYENIGIEILKIDGDGSVDEIFDKIRIGIDKKLIKY